MNKTFPKAIKRAAAWLMTLLMLVSQLAAPVAALAMDVSTLPVISVNYTDWDGNPQTVMVYPADTGDQVVYWAQMPENIKFSPFTEFVCFVEIFFHEVGDIIF